MELTISDEAVEFLGRRGNAMALDYIPPLG